MVYIQARLLPHPNPQGDSAGTRKKVLERRRRGYVPGWQAPPAVRPAAPGPGERRFAPGTRVCSAGPPSGGGSSPTAPAPESCTSKQQRAYSVLSPAPATGARPCTKATEAGPRTKDTSEAN